MRSIWQRRDVLTADGDTSITSGAGVFTPFVYTLRRFVTSHFSLLGVSSQTPTMGLPEKMVSVRLITPQIISLPFPHTRGSNK
jgi:hypothetical protein